MSSFIPEHPKILRQSIRRGEFIGNTGGLHLGKVQANLVMLPASEALEFLIFLYRKLLLFLGNHLDFLEASFLWRFSSSMLEYL